MNSRPGLTGWYWLYIEFLKMICSKCTTALEYKLAIFFDSQNDIDYTIKLLKLNEI